MFVRLMADYCSDGVWNERGSMMDRDELPISDSLKFAIADWCLDYERSQFYIDEASRTTDFDVVAFNARGEELAKRLSQELPGWLVTHQQQ